VGEIVFDLENPLGRLPGESLRANQALRDYALQGPGRSQRKLFEQYRQQIDSKTTAEKPPAKRLRTLAEWSSRFAWQGRVEAWERLMDATDEQKWAERRHQLREDEWEIGLAYLELVRNGLAESPKFIKTQRRIVRETGQEIITLAIDLASLAKAGEAGDRLLRIAADMSDHIIKQKIDQHVDVVEMTLDEWKEEQKRRQEQVRQVMETFEEPKA
jgi:hypothetical protein